MSRTNHCTPILLSLLALMATLLLAACGESSAGQSTPTPLPPVVSVEKAIFTVERGPIVMSKDINAEVVPSKQDELFFRAAGYVNRVVVKQGDVVKKGDILAEMQIDDLMNQLQQARIDLEVAQSNLAKAKSQRQLNLERAKADVVIAQKRVDLAAIDVQNSGGVGRERAQINLDIANQNLLLSQSALQKMTEETNPYEEQAVQRSQLAVERLEKLVAERQIIAPYDCQVLRSLIRPGTQVSAFTAMFVVGDPSSLVVRAPMDYDLQGKLTPDSEVTLSTDSASQDPADAFPIQFLPNFLPMSANTEENKTTSGYETDFLYFTLPKDVPADKVPVGRTVFLTIIQGRKEDALLLPPAAIREYKGLNFVIVQEGDRRRRVEINEIGLKGEALWEISGDLQEGDQVLGP